jgi:hypothetical protein
MAVARRRCYRHPLWPSPLKNYMPVERKAAKTVGEDGIGTSGGGKGSGRGRGNGVATSMTDDEQWQR